MQAIRQIYESLPDVIRVPAELRRRKVEVIILPLDENEAEAVKKTARPQFGNARGQVTMSDDFDAPLNEFQAETKQLDANGYPLGFFEETFGSIPDLPKREAQPALQSREEVE